MTLESTIALALATAILGLSPGPAVFATIGRALTMPLARVYLFIAGIIAGDALYALLAMIGLAVLAQKFTLIFLLLKVVGGGYLIYLGIKSWSSTSQPHFREVQHENAIQLFSSGFLLTSSNPKDLLFFIGFLPLFIDLKTAGFNQMAFATLVIVLTFVGTLSVYAIGAAYVRHWFQDERAVIWLHRTAAVLMCAVGIAVIAG